MKFLSKFSGTWWHTAQFNWFVRFVSEFDNGHGIPHNLISLSDLLVDFITAMAFSMKLILPFNDEIIVRNIYHFYHHSSLLWPHLEANILCLFAQIL